MRIINRLKKTHDHNPQVLAEFQAGVASVIIRVWIVVNQNNTELVLADDTCYQIGNTNNWGWSTEHLPFASGISGYQYYFEMTANTAEVQSREFHLTVPERGRWVHKAFLA